MYIMTTSKMSKGTKSGKSGKSGKGSKSSKSSKSKSVLKVETTPEVVAAPAPAPAPEVVAAPAPEVVAAPALTEDVKNTVVSPESVNDQKLKDFSSAFNSVLTRLNELNTLNTAIKNEVRKLEKQMNRELKASYKLNAKKRRKNVNRSPSGFVKPTLISTELAKFLGKEDGCEMARTEVTKELNVYIRTHKLQDKNNGRQINADASLAKLLKLGKDDVLTYFNLQKFMSPHFAKSTKNVVSTTA
jgi:chromatin remodeling complex protein RSC6